LERNRSRFPHRDIKKLHTSTVVVHSSIVEDTKSRVTFDTSSQVACSNLRVEGPPCIGKIGPDGHVQSLHKFA
ncbi:hypothetical protein WG66_005807, partial [Moniliophthora roreri]